MKLKDEVKFRFVLLIVGLVIIAFTQIMINTIPPSTVFVTPSPYSPLWLPLKYKQWLGPFGLVRIQEAGLIALAAGVTLLIRPFVFNYEQLTYDRERGRWRERCDNSRQDIKGLQYDN